MIQKIKIKNGQSLRDVTFELGKVTVIRGKSDVGKSALIRLLEAFFENQFSEEYAYKGNLPFGIAIQKDDKVVIGRRTSKGVEYKFNNIVYSKTAKNVPPEVLSFLGIHEVFIDKDISIFLHIQNQFDPPFLISKETTATTVAKILGRISNLNIVLMAMRSMSADQLSKTQELNIVKNNLVNEEKKLESYKDLDTKGEILSKLKVLIASKEADTIYLESLKSLNTDFIDNAREILENQKSIETIDELLSKVEAFDYTSLYNNFISLNLLKEELELFNLEVSSLKSKISIVDSFNIAICEENIKTYTELLEIKEFSDDLNKDIISYKENLSIVESSLKSAENNLSKLLEEQKVCPFSLGVFFQECKDIIKKSNVN